jgi:hypothetical protein
MILREMFNTSSDSDSMSNDPYYDGSRDTLMPMHRKDTRKTRLSLKQINELRKASEQHILEQESELEFIETMYKAPAAPAAV